MASEKMRICFNLIFLAPFFYCAGADLFSAGILDHPGYMKSAGSLTKII
jgi:hypothetical protein